MSSWGQLASYMTHHVNNVPPPSGDLPSLATNLTSSLTSASSLGNTGNLSNAGSLSNSAGLISAGLSNSSNLGRIVNSSISNTGRPRNSPSNRGNCSNIRIITAGSIQGRGKLQDSKHTQSLHVRI